jgi:hypothetical protein
LVLVALVVPVVDQEIPALQEAILYLETLQQTLQRLAEDTVPQPLHHLVARAVAVAVAQILAVHLVQGAEPQALPDKAMLVVGALTAQVAPQAAEVVLDQLA